MQPSRSTFRSSFHFFAPRHIPTILKNFHFSRVHSAVQSTKSPPLPPPVLRPSVGQFLSIWSRSSSPPRWTARPRVPWKAPFQRAWSVSSSMSTGERDREPTLQAETPLSSSPSQDQSSSWSAAPPCRSSGGTGPDMEVKLERPRPGVPCDGLQGLHW